MTAVKLKYTATTVLQHGHSGTGDELSVAESKRLNLQMDFTGELALLTHCVATATTVKTPVSP